MPKTWDMKGNAEMLIQGWIIGAVGVLFLEMAVALGVIAVKWKGGK